MNAGTYSRGIRLGVDYVAARCPRLTCRQFWGTVVRTIGYIASALICSALVHHVDHAWTFAVRVGLVTGIVTGVRVTITLTSNITLTIFRSDALAYLVSGSSFAGLCCNLFSTGWRCSMYT